LGFWLDMLKRDLRLGVRRLCLRLGYLLLNLVCLVVPLSQGSGRYLMLMAGSILLLSDTEMIRIFAGAASMSLVSSPRLSSLPALLAHPLAPSPQPFSALSLIISEYAKRGTRLTSDIAGRAISPGEWTAANTYVHAWAKSQDGAYACYTAMECTYNAYMFNEDI